MRPPHETPDPYGRSTKRQQKKPQNTSCCNPCSDFVLHSCWYRHWVRLLLVRLPPPLYPSLAVTLEKSVTNWAELQWRMVGGDWSRKKKGQFVHFYKDMWRVRREMYRERSAGRQWESGKMVQQAVFIMTGGGMRKRRIWKAKKGGKIKTVTARSRSGEIMRLSSEIVR